MPSIHYKNWYLMLAAVFICHSGSLLAQAATPAAAEYYKQLTGNALKLYNGSEYIRTYPGVAGHPFILSDSMQEGSITYDGVTYPGVRLNYDIVRDLVIVRGPQVFSIELVTSKIDSFSMSGRRFYRAVHTGAGRSSAGFYEVLHSGNVNVLAKWEKKKPVTAAQDELPQFEVSTQYYVATQNSWHRITRKEDLLQAFRTQKEPLKRLMQQNKLNFREAPEQMLLAVARFFDQNKE